MDSVEQFEALLEATQDIVVVIDADGEVGYVNAAIERLGHAPAEFVGDNAFEYVHPDDRTTVIERFQSVIGQPEETSDRVEHRFRTASGDWRWLESVASNHTTSALNGYVVNSRDVSDRKATERDHEQLLELAENAEDVLWAFTADWETVLFVNDAYEVVYGGDVATLSERPRSFLEAVHPEDRDRVRRAMERASAGDPVDIEYRVDASENYDRWVWVKAEPIVEDGEVTQVVGFSRDVTGRRERERQLQVMDRVLRHNLHNDMNVIQGYAEQVAADVPAVAEEMGVVRQYCGRLLETVDKEREVVELLTERPGRTRVQLSTTTSQIVESLAGRHPEASVDLQVDDGVAVVAIPQLPQAVEELVENALIHAGDDAPTVSVTVAAADGTATVTVADDGPGIPEEETAVLTDAEHIEPLFHGSGMGLWLVSWIVRLSGGSLSFAPNDPSGSVVTIELETASR